MSIVYPRKKTTISAGFGFDRGDRFAAGHGSRDPSDGRCTCLSCTRMTCRRYDLLMIFFFPVFFCASFFDFLFVCWCPILFECMMMYGHELFRALKLVAAMQLPMGTGVAGRPSNIWEALQPTEEFEKITFKIIRVCILRHFSFQHDDWIF